MDHQLTSRILEIKLDRINELNARMRDNLNRKRVPVSEASVMYVLHPPQC